MSVFFLRRDGEPISNIKASDIPVGTVVMLKESGVNTEYIVVNHGIPQNNTEIYAANCAGTWLMRKDALADSEMEYSPKYGNFGESTTVLPYLNTTHLARFDADTLAAIKEVNVPYRADYSSSNLYLGDNGVLTKAFILSTFEMGFHTAADADSTIRQEGDLLAYFADGDTSKYGVSSPANAKVFTRTMYKSAAGSTTYVFYARGNEINRQRALSTSTVTYTAYIRPVIIFDDNALFDGNTFVYKKMPNS